MLTMVVNRLTERMVFQGAEQIRNKHRLLLLIDEFLKGKSAIAIARLSGEERNFPGEHFWARGYAVSTGGIRTGAGPPIHPRAGSCGW